MLAKLLRYEWKASRKLIAAICAAVFGACLLAGGSARFMTWAAISGNGLMVTFYTLVIALTVLLVIGCCFGALYIMAYQFYKHCFTDQGYLTFALPVTAHQLLLAHILSILRGVLIIGSVSCLSVFLAWSIFTSIFQGTGAIEMANLGKEILITASRNLLGTDSLPRLSVVMALAGSILSFLAELILIMLALTTGCLSSRHGTVKGLGIYFGISILHTLVTDFALETMAPIPASLLGMGCALVMILGGYFRMHHLLEHKLNLT